MNLVRVAPISRGISKDVLSYFSKHTFSPGALVSIPLRGKEKPALVLSCEGAEKHKSEIRAQGFSLKKIEKSDHHTFLLPSFVEAAEETARYHASTVGAVLSSLLPTTLLDEALDAPENTKPKVCPPSFHDLFLVQTSEEERFGSYKSMIREAFARSSSIFILCPTILEATHLHAYLNQGIEEYCFLLHGGLSKKKRLHAWDQAQQEEHPVVIIGTPSFLSLPREDIETFIVEHESSPHYKLPARPYVDVRTFTEALARKQCARYIVGDILVRTETLWRHKTGEGAELYPVLLRYRTPSTGVLIDMKQYKSGRGESLKLFSERLTTELEAVESRQKKALIYVTRKGRNTLTVCEDCGETLECPRCHYPVVLKGDSERIFSCTVCKHEFDARVRCGNCTSWRLKALGIGIELVEEHLAREFPTMPITRIDSDTTTPAQARKAARSFEESDHGIMLTTEMGLSYIHTSVSLTAAVSLDSLLSLPDLYMNERIFRLILDLKMRAQDTCIIQTRNPHTALLKDALKGNIREFYEREIGTRERFSYPPFSTLIKLTVTAPSARTKELLGTIKNELASYDPEIYPAFISEVKGNKVYHAMISVKRNQWVDDELREILTSLPQEIAIDVAPLSLL